MLLLLGCAVGPDYVPPEPRLPDRWELELTRGLGDGQADLQTWWTLLDDRQLAALIDRATEGNLDLRLAVARVAESRARRGIAQAGWFPSIFGDASYDRGKLSQEEFQPLPRAGSTNDRYSAGLDGTWELDVFGRIRRASESASAAYEASVEDYRDVLVVVLADVAASYVEVRTLQARIRFARANAEVQRGTLDLTRERNRAGLAPDLDVHQAELNLAETQAVIPSLEQGSDQTLHALGVLLGEHPGALRAELAAEAPIPQPPEQVGLGLPADLVRQRPDIRAAERELAEATALIGVATADLYPRFALLGSISTEALTTASLFDGDATAYSLGPSLSWNLFDGGRVRANIAAEDAQTEQALVLYESTVLQALEEAENAIVGYEREWERRDALARSVEAARASVELVKKLYINGLTDFQNVQATERALFRQQDQLAQSEGAVTQNVIRLYRALGGGWRP